MERFYDYLIRMALEEMVYLPDDEDEIHYRTRRIEEKLKLLQEFFAPSVETILSYISENKNHLQANKRDAVFLNKALDLCYSIMSDALFEENFSNKRMFINSLVNRIEKVLPPELTRERQLVAKDFSNFKDLDDLLGDAK
ncbi:MAG TPA: hypothetical protein P5136_02735 [Methanofastidiosum sp.]|nr:hypothetical protein [Methanofastidiosum sp.]